jgi:hypothetical protein
MKSKLGVAVGVVYVLLGVSVAITPDLFLSITDWGSQRGLLAGAAMRVVVGIALLLAAPNSRYPRALRILGIIALIGGVTMPFIPLGFWAAYMRWWIVENASAFRWVFATAAMLFGTFIVYAALPRRTDT